MNSTKDTFNERVAEINFYYSALGQLDDALRQSYGTYVEPIERYRLDSFLKTKAFNALVFFAQKKAYWKFLRLLARQESCLRASARGAKPSSSCDKNPRT